MKDLIVKLRRRLARTSRGTGQGDSGTGRPSFVFAMDSLKALPARAAVTHP